MGFGLDLPGYLSHLLYSPPTPAPGQSPHRPEGLQPPGVWTCAPLSPDTCRPDPLTALRPAEMPPPQGVPPQTPAPPGSLAALSFTVVLNTILLTVAFTDLTFFILPRPQLECKCPEERGIFIRYFIPSTPCFIIVCVRLTDI